LVWKIHVCNNALYCVFPTVPGCQANTSDIAPKYSGILYGISNTLAAIPGFLAPQIAGVILQDVVRLALFVK